MTLLLLFTCSLVFGCFAAPAVDDPLQRLQQEVEQLKRTYDEKTLENAEKIASLEERAEWGRNLSSQLGKCLFFPYRINP